MKDYWMGYNIMIFKQYILEGLIKLVNSDTILYLITIDKVHTCCIIYSTIGHNGIHKIGSKLKSKYGTIMNKLLKNIHFY